MPSAAEAELSCSIYGAAEAAPFQNKFNTTIQCSNSHASEVGVKSSVYGDSPDLVAGYAD